MQMPGGHLLAAGSTAATPYNLPKANWQRVPSGVRRPKGGKAVAWWEGAMICCLAIS